MVEPFIIDLRARMFSAKLFSRLVWQRLFDIYREGGGDLSQMDSLLCDLYTIERFFDEWLRRKSEAPDFYWEFDGCWTDIKSFDSRMGCYHISLPNEYHIVIEYIPDPDEPTPFPAKKPSFWESFKWFGFRSPIGLC